MKKVLIVDDDRATSAGVADVIEEWGYEAEVTDTLKAGWASVSKMVPDVAIVDLKLPDGSGLDLLHKIKEHYPDVSVVILTGHATVDSAVKALKVGAEDYVTKPVDLPRLQVILKTVEDKQMMKQEILELRRQLQKMGALGHLVGKSPRMQRLFEEIEMVANTDANVFIVGESGSGKEVVANTIHSLSRRRMKPFIAFNCGAISPTLIESEIFGHERAPSPTPSSGVKATSKWPRAARCSSTRSRRCRSSCRSNCCACSKKGSSAASAATKRSTSTRASSPRRTAIRRRRSSTARCARISTTG